MLHGRHEFWLKEREKRERENSYSRQIVSTIATCVVPDEWRYNYASNDTVKTGIWPREGEK